MAGEIHFSSPGVWKWELHNSGKGGWWQRGGKGHHWTESPPMSLLETTHWCGSPGLSAPSMHLSATAHTSPLNALQPYSPHLPPQCTSRLQPTPPPSMHLSPTAHTSLLNAPQPYSLHLPPQCTSRLQPTPPPTLPWVPCACSCVSLQKCILANRKSTKITNHHNQ